MDRVQAHRYFQTYNHERIHRLLTLAPPRHSLILELLPFLFHINAKVLPGYLSDETPAGLIDYRPDNTTLDKARQLDKNFRYRRRALRRYPLRGLYLINPHGLLTYPQQPDFSLWLLFSKLLTPQQRQQLKQKAEAICAWAAQAGLQITPRLLSEDDLERGVLTHWERDQFYSSGLVLAGSHPYWWLTSPEDDLDYPATVAKLQSQRMLKQVSLVDFGVVGPFDADSLFHAASTTLKQSLMTGAHGLRLFYLDACLQAPADSALSSLLKQGLYQQQADTAVFDVSCLSLQKLETARNQPAAREALYLMTGEALSKPVRQALFPWRRSFVKALTECWGWDQDKIRALDQLPQDISASRERFQALGQFSKQLIKQLQMFARTHHLDGDSTLAELTRLYRLRHEPGFEQIHCLPLPMRPAANSDRLFITRFRDQTQWQLSQVPLDNPHQHSLYQHENLLHILGFAIANQLLSASNWLSVNDQHQRVTTSGVVELLQQLLHSSLPGSDLTIDENSLQQAEQLTSIWLFSNLEQQPTDKLAQQGLQLSSKQNDPLNYSSQRQSLVLSTAGLIQSSYGLWYSFSFADDHAVLETLRYLLSWQSGSAPERHCWCPTAIFGQAISHRMTVLLAQVMAHSRRFPDSGRILLNIADRPYTLQWHSGQVEYIRRPLSQDIWQSLAANTQAFQPTILDRFLDSDGLFNALLAHQAPDRITVFVYLEKNTVICYLLDENGNLIRQQYQHLTESTLITHLHTFLSAIKSRNQLSHLRFYRLQRQPDQWQSTPLAIPAQTQAYLPVTVEMNSTALDANCSVRCGQKWFEGRADDPALFAKVQQLVLSLRQQQKNYPVYINSLLFNDGQYYPAGIYLQQKQRLEQLFNPG